MTERKVSIEMATAKEAAEQAIERMRQRLLAKKIVQFAAPSVIAEVLRRSKE